MSGWESVAISLANVFRFARTEIVTNPRAKIMILIRNESVGEESQFEVGDIPHEQMPAWLRRAADKIEHDLANKSEAIKGKARIPSSKVEETPVIFDRAKNKK